MGWRTDQPDLRIVWPSDKVTEYFSGGLRLVTSCILHLATCVGRVKHQRKGPNNTAKETTRVDMRRRVLLGITILMEGGSMTVHCDCD